LVRRAPEGLTVLWEWIIKLDDIRYRLWLPERRGEVFDVLRLSVSAGLVVAALVALVWTMGAPLVLGGVFGGRVVFLESLSQVEPVYERTPILLSFCSVAANHDEFAYCNWRDPELYLDGQCWCGAPYAPSGTFLVSWLPKGIGITWSNGKHMTEPKYLPRATLLPVAVVLGLPLSVGPLRRRTRKWRGCCVLCGYDLTGNESGTCPECGRVTVAHV
jgi:hypothetical protein